MGDRQKQASPSGLGSTFPEVAQSWQVEPWPGCCSDHMPPCAVASRSPTSKRGVMCVVSALHEDEIPRGGQRFLKYFNKCKLLASIFAASF